MPMAPAAENDIENVCDRCLWVVGIMAQELKIPLGIRRARMNYHPAERLRDDVTTANNSNSP